MIGLKLGNQYPHWRFPQLVDLQRLKVPGAWVDAVGGEAARLQTSYVQEVTLGVEAESPGHGFGGRMADGRQTTVRGVKGETGDAVVSPVGRIQEFPRRCNLNLRARVLAAETFGQSGNGLEGGYRALG